MSTYDLTTNSDLEQALGKKRSSRPRNWRMNLLVMVTLIVVALIMAMPFIWLVSSSLKNQVDIFAYPPKWIPDPIRWENYTEALTYKPFGVYVKNTMIIVTLNIIAVVFTSSFCAYGFARIRFPGRDFWFGIVLATLFLPYVVTLVPTFIIFSRLPAPQIDLPLLGLTRESKSWVDTFLPLTVPLFFGGGAFNIFLLRQFFRTIPEELADAARIDGCSEFGIYWRIMMPLSKPALITVAIFTFLASWNDLLGPIIYLRRPEMHTVAIGLAGFRTGQGLATRWDLQMAAATAMIIPVAALFFVAQRYFIRGIVLSGLKG